MLFGFGNIHQSEAVKGILPKTQNSPQTLPYNLYAEQLNGSAFTRDRKDTLYTWVYRRLPSVVRPDFEPREFIGQSKPCLNYKPNPMRWSPVNYLENQTSDFIDSLRQIACNEHSHVYLYDCNQSMDGHYFADLDGELLFIPFEGQILLKTELGELDLAPGQIAVIPRGMYWKMELTSDKTKGYLCENRGLPFQLPELGVIGVNGLAHPNHFVYPEASYEPEPFSPVTIVIKHGDQLWTGRHAHTPLNVIAWRGNYAPYRYDLNLFNTINTVSYDHIDPSIFTVLTSPSHTPGVAAIDFVIFPHRWMVAEHSFRPPYFHRNIMSELMGLVHGQYDAKQEGFSPGGFSIHNAMIPHGPDKVSTDNALVENLEPMYFDKGLAFMLESNLAWSPSEWAMGLSQYQRDYVQCWQGITPGEL